MAFYSQVIDTVVPVSSTRVAEMVKLLENTFRAVNIGLVNELALMCHRMNIDVWEVIDAAKTKPFGFMPFYPGPGLGGHCIPIDPFYLSWKARQSGFEARFIELAGNDQRRDAGIRGRSHGRSAELREEGGQRIARARVRHRLQARRERHARVAGARHHGAADPARREVTYTDPYVPSLEHGTLALKLESTWPAAAGACDCALIVTDHKVFDYPAIAKTFPLIVDTRNALKGIASEKIFRL